MNSIKIGLFVDSWFPMIDGVTNVVYNYAKILSKVADVIVFTCGTKKQDNKTYPFKVVRCKSFAVKNFDYEIPKITRKFKKAIIDEKLDIIHIHSPFMVGNIGVKLAKKHKIPVVGTIHSQYEQDFFRYTKNKFITKQLLKRIIKTYNKCDVVYVVNQKMPTIVEKYGLNNSSVVHNNGTHILPLKNTDIAYNYFEKKYNIKKDETVLLFVGRISLIKNLLFLVDALKILKNKNISFKMLFVGSGNDEKVIKEKVERLGLTKEVLFLGRVSDEVIVYAYARAKLFLFPSIYDTSSLVQIESASQKTPTVFIRGSLTSATITENVNGFMADDDATDFALTIEKILNDKDLYKKVSENAFKQIYITWEETVMKMFDNYLKIINNYNNKNN